MCLLLTDFTPSATNAAIDCRSTLHCWAGATRPICPCVNSNALRSAFLQTSDSVYTSWLALLWKKSCVRPFVAAEGAADQPRIRHRLCLLFSISCRLRSWPLVWRPAVRHPSSCIFLPDMPAIVGALAKLVKPRSFHIISMLISLISSVKLSEFKEQVCGEGMFLVLIGIKIQMKSWTFIIKFTALLRVTKW